jgi:hypothetical protein
MSLPIAVLLGFTPLDKGKGAFVPGEMFSRLLKKSLEWFDKLTTNG